MESAHPVSAPEIDLRLMSVADLDVLWHWNHEVDDAAWQQWDAPYFPRGPRLELSEFRSQNRHRIDHPHQRMILIDGAPVGFVSRYEESPVGGGWWELGIVIFDPRYWGRGIGRRVLSLWTEVTFSRSTGVHVITLTTWSGNERMVRSAQAVGYRECARIPEARSWNGQRWDSVKLALLRRDWAGRDRHPR